jgi:hypothetical protein
MKVSVGVVVLLVALSQAQDAAANDGSRQSCESYIEKGNWIYRFNEWSLSLVPTECGRNINPADTAEMFYEIAKKFAGSV